MKHKILFLPVAACLMLSLSPNLSNRVMADDAISDSVSNIEIIQNSNVTFPKKFIDYRKYIGDYLENLGIVVTEDEYSGFTNNITTANFYGHTGNVYIHFTEDNLVWAIHLDLKNDTLSSSELDEIENEITDVFGSDIITSSTSTDFSGNGDYQFTLRNNNCIITWNYEKCLEYYNSTYDDEDLNTYSYEKQAPAIGMSKQEILNSTWGTPKDKNKITTKYGIHEQWIYDNNKYIYFDDEIVSAIQE